MIKNVGATKIKAKHRASCHCGAVLLEYGYNVGCLEGGNPFDLAKVPINDGVIHPADRSLLNDNAE